jgi:hypothetical protein
VQEQVRGLKPNAFFQKPLDLRQVADWLRTDPVGR